MIIQKANRIVTFNKLDQIGDARSATIAVVERRPAKKITIKKPTFDYGRREVFAPAEYNLQQIGVIEDTESYVRQSFQKKAALMFKEGEKFVGNNIETIKYIKKRMLQMEHASGMSWKQLLKDTGYALISRSNFFWVKVRKEAASGGRTIGGLQPVAAYFGMGAENVRIKKNKQGKVVKYRQIMPDGRKKDFMPRDIIHFYAYKKPGIGFGVPQIIPVIDDIRALRRIEENVELLIYQTLFPIFQYKVGTESRPAGDVRVGEVVMSEVDHVKAQIQDMPAEGGIVTPERHEISFIGAEGKALKAKEYLDYFKTRVLSGLGTSSVDMGEGSTANRATADVLSSAIVDSVKDFQGIIADVINQEVIKELLLESTFGFDVLSDEHIAGYKFKEIDIEAQMKKNTNAQVLYNGDLITIDEARERIGEEPISPEQEELMYTQRITMPVAQLEADAALEQVRVSAALKPSPSSSSESTTAAKSAKNSNSPTNQHGTKTGPQKSRLDYFKIKDSYVTNAVRALKKDILLHIGRQLIDRNWVASLIDLTKKDIMKRYEGITLSEFLRGLDDSGATFGQHSEAISKDYIDVQKNTELYINKYLRDLRGKINRALDKMVWDGEDRKKIVDKVAEIFDTLKYRGDFIDATQRMKAYNYGKAIGLQKQGFVKATMNLNPACSICSTKPTELELKTLDIDDVPPFHPNSVGTVGYGIN